MPEALVFFCDAEESSPLADALGCCGASPKLGVVPSLGSKTLLAEAFVANKTMEESKKQISGQPHG